MFNQLSIAAKSALRNFRKNWLYGSLNILGLSIAFASLILVITYLYQETNYDGFYQHADRIYRPTYHLTGQNDFDVHFARIPVNYINELPKEIPEIEKLIRFQNAEQKYIRIGEKRFKPKHAYITDYDVFEVTRQYTVFKNRLKEIPGINEVAACMQIPSSEIRDMGPVLVRGVNEEVSHVPMMDMQIIDPNFIEMMDLTLLAGENFTSKVVLKQVPEFNEELSVGDYLADAPRAYLINETAMKQLGWREPSQAIGQKINWSIGPFELAYGPIIAVIKDYHQESLKNKVDPLVMVVEPLWLQNILIKVETKDLEKTISSIENIWNDLFPYALEYEFLDELFSRLYQQDRIQLKLLTVLTLIAMLISFIGLVSLVAFALKRRSKELAIRRVIGADLRSLTTLISKEYFWVLAVATLVGVPISYQWASDWLQNFAYHINISPFVYLLAVLLVYALLLLTIYLQTLKATIDNPVQALREE